MVEDIFKISREGLNKVLGIVDQMLAGRYKDLGIDWNEDEMMVRLRATCKICHKEIAIEQRINPNGPWGATLMYNITDKCRHHVLEHDTSGLILPANAGDYWEPD